MLPIGLNHMTAPRTSVAALLDLAGKLGCVGVEFRNDLGTDLFAGLDPVVVGEQAKSANLRILALAEVKSFNDLDRDVLGDATTLIKIAHACSGEGVALIPKVATATVPRDAQRSALKQSLALLKPLLEDHNQVGLIEPLGFSNSSLRFKDDVAAVLDDLNRPDCFRLIHDTFHHHLAQTDGLHAGLTSLVHISGVIDPVSNDQMADAHRVLVGPGDRLGNIEQLKALRRQGYAGPASFEAFSTDIQELVDPADELAGSINFIADQMAGQLA